MRVLLFCWLVFLSSTLYAENASEESTEGHFVIGGSSLTSDCYCYEGISDDNRAILAMVRKEFPEYLGEEEFESGKSKEAKGAQ